MVHSQGRTFQAFEVLPVSCAPTPLIPQSNSNPHENIVTAAAGSRDAGQPAAAALSLFSPGA
jgi:hypothetical protein